MGQRKGIILAAGKGSRMRSDLPKVLHEINGKPMVLYSIDVLRGLGVDDIILVVGYKNELIEQRLKGVPNVRFALQAEQKGTGHAVMQAAPLLQGYDGEVFVIYGDMPLLKPETLRQLPERLAAEQAAAVLLTLTMDNPPEFGRIVRNAQRGVQRIVEVRDASPEIFAINEVNVGVYLFRAPLLVQALSQITDSNAQREYYLTDVVEVLARQGQRVVTVPVEELDEVMGVNAQYQREYAERLDDIRHAESMYQLIDAVARMRRR